MIKQYLDYIKISRYFSGHVHLFCPSSSAPGLYERKFEQTQKEKHREKKCFTNL